uniref:Uncharacterized protein n=1 Tax=Arundo donax TaxID=35708 RepID=A0A0A9FCK9_ARUDO
MVRIFLKFKDQKLVFAYVFSWVTFTNL